MVKVTYLEHSGFVLEYESCALIFDYYKGTLPDLSDKEKIYVFVSHGHYDHFQKKIFEWKEQYENITYILSADVYESVAPKWRAACLFVEADGDYETDDMQIRTLTSTDEGVAFVIRWKGKTIYHAGDLNWWHWEEEDDESWNLPMQAAYAKEIGKIEGEKIDIAFVPLDMRQGQQYYWGLDYYMRHTDTGCVFPMHMWEKGAYQKLMKEPAAASYRDRVMPVEEPQQTFQCE